MTTSWWREAPADPGERARRLALLDVEHDSDEVPAAGDRRDRALRGVVDEVPGTSGTAEETVATAGVWPSKQY